MPDHAALFLTRLSEISDAFIAKARAGDADACAKFYTPDAIGDFVGGKVKGRPALARMFAQWMAEGWQPDALATLHCGATADMGYAVQEVVGTGQRVMLVMRRQPDGGWLVAHEAVLHG